MLRTLFIYTGFVILLGCIGYSINSDSNGHIFVPINIGYFLIIITCFICATIYRGDVKNQRVRFLIYQAAAESKLSLAELADKVKSNYLNSSGDAYTIIRKEITMMIEEGRLKLKDGLVVIV